MSESNPIVASIIVVAVPLPIVRRGPAHRAASLAVDGSRRDALRDRRHAQRQVTLRIELRAVEDR